MSTEKGKKNKKICRYSFLLCSTPLYFPPFVIMSLLLFNPAMAGPVKVLSSTPSHHVYWVLVSKDKETQRRMIDLSHEGEKKMLLEHQIEYTDIVTIFPYAAFSIDVHDLYVFIVVAAEVDALSYVLFAAPATKVVLLLDVPKDSRAWEDRVHRIPGFEQASVLLESATWARELTNLPDILTRQVLLRMRQHTASHSASESDDDDVDSLSSSPREADDSDSEDESSNEVLTLPSQGPRVRPDPVSSPPSLAVQRAETDKAWTMLHDYIIPVFKQWRAAADKDKGFVVTEYIPDAHPERIVYCCVPTMRREHVCITADATHTLLSYFVTRVLTWPTTWSQREPVRVRDLRAIVVEPKTVPHLLLFVDDRISPEMLMLHLGHMRLAFDQHSPALLSIVRVVNVHCREVDLPLAPLTTQVDLTALDALWLPVLNMLGEAVLR